MNKILFFLVLFWSQEVASQCAHPDLEAMKSFYRAAGGNKWTYNNGWKEGAEGTNCDPCSGWKGVACENGRVTRIILDSNYMYGTISPSIGELTELKWITLSRNFLTGNIPESLFKLSHLNNINLFDNILEGNIAPEIKNLKNLTNLNLSFNELSGPLPSEIWEIRNISEVLLNNNMFSGSISPKIGEAIKLKRLELQDNLLTGSIPLEIGRCTLVYKLILSQNMLSGNVPESINNLRNLEVLYLDFNKLNGSLPDRWNETPNIIQLGLSNNQISGEIPESFSDFIEIYILDLSNNKLTGQIPTSLLKNKNLYYLNLSYNDLSGCIDPSFSKLCDSIYFGIKYTRDFFADVPTVNLSNNPKLPQFNGFRDFCNTDRSLSVQQGRPCDDGFAATINDVIKDDCTCQGTIIDPCLVIKVDTFTTIVYDTISKEYINNIYLNDTLYIQYHPSNTLQAQSIDLKVYPNPVFDKFYISIDQNSVQNPSLYQIYSNLGQSVASGKLNDSLTEVDVSAMHLNGLYLLKLYDGNLRTMVTVKLIFVKN